MKPCDHKTAGDHVVGGDATVRPLTWICSVCGKKFRWTETSSYKGSIECPKCGFAAIEVVCCDEACRRAVSSGERSLR